MNVADITVADFKAQFYRGFNYLPVWLNSQTYNIGDLVYYNVTELFYTCKTNGTTSIPTTTADWTVTAGNIYDYVLDEDINGAYAEAGLVFNPNITATDAQFKLIFLYLAAHYLVCDLRAGGTKSGIQTIVSSRSVGSVSESYEIPKWMQKESLSFYVTTYYGVKYLNLTRIYRVGNACAIRGNGPYNVFLNVPNNCN